MKYLIYPMALAVILLTGYVHGDHTGRWGASEELRAAVARLDRVPRVVGDWRGEDLEIDPRQLEIGEIAGNVVRRYVNTRTGDAVSVLVVCGRPGPISAHTPEWCYGGAGYHADSMATNLSIPTSAADAAAIFWRNVFEKENSPIGEALRIDWAWNAGNGWKAPENPRVAYAPRRFLYKLYVVCDPAADEGRPTDREVDRAFLDDFLPGLDDALSPETIASHP